MGKKSRKNRRAVEQKNSSDAIDTDAILSTNHSNVSRRTTEHEEDTSSKGGIYADYCDYLEKVITFLVPNASLDNDPVSNLVEAAKKLQSIPPSICDALGRCIHIQRRMLNQGFTDSQTQDHSILLSVLLMILHAVPSKEARSSSPTSVIEPTTTPETPSSMGDDTWDIMNDRDIASMYDAIDKDCTIQSLLQGSECFRVACFFTTTQE